MNIFQLIASVSPNKLKINIVSKFINIFSLKPILHCPLAVQMKGNTNVDDQLIDHQPATRLNIQGDSELI